MFSRANFKTTHSRSKLSYTATLVILPVVVIVVAEDERVADVVELLLEALVKHLPVVAFLN